MYRGLLTYLNCYPFTVRWDVRPSFTTLALTNLSLEDCSYLDRRVLIC